MAAVKGVIYNQEKTYSGLKNQWRYYYWGRQSTEGRYLVGGGTTVVQILKLVEIDHGSRVKYKLSVVFRHFTA